MNQTFVSLTLKKTVLDSPFFSSHFSTTKTHFTFSSSSFSFVTNKIIYSRANSIGNLRDSSFSNILGGAVLVDGNLAFVNQTYNNFQKMSYNHFNIERCIFERCTNLAAEGGAIESNMANFTTTDTIFRENQARIGGAAHILRSPMCVFDRVLFYSNKAEYAGGFHYDALNEQNTTEFYNINITKNVAEKWTGAFRIDHGGGKLNDIILDSNEALVAAGYLDYAWKPTHKILKRWIVRNNKCVSRGAGITLFHIKSSLEIHDSVFYGNKCDIDAKSISLQNVDGYFLAENCFFDGRNDKELYPKYNETLVLIENCKFEIPEKEIVLKFEEMAKNIQKPVNV